MFGLLLSSGCLHGRPRRLASLRGSHPGLFCIEGLGKLTAAADAELAVGPGQVSLDGLEGDVEKVGDFPIRPALGSQPGDTKLAWRECFCAAAPFATGPSACRLELL